MCLHSLRQCSGREFVVPRRHFILFTLWRDTVGYFSGSAVSAFFFVGLFLAHPSKSKAMHTDLNMLMIMACVTHVYVLSLRKVIICSSIRCNTLNGCFGLGGSLMGRAIIISGDSSEWHSAADELSQLAEMERNARHRRRLSDPKAARPKISRFTLVPNEQPIRSTSYQHARTHTPNRCDA